jgi:glutathione-independent formaldehyde dehydrogenase
MVSNSNRGVVYLKPGSVEVQKIDFPSFRNPAGKTIDHSVILKVVTTNICGSDQHMVRGRTTAPAGMALGHEITGEVIEKGRDVEYLDIGDLVSVPFNVACGRCRTCREGDTDVCLHVNSDRAGGAYGYAEAQAEVAMFGRLLLRPRIVGYIQAGNTDCTGRPRDFHKAV